MYEVVIIRLQSGSVICEEKDHSGFSRINGKE